MRHLSVEKKASPRSAMLARLAEENNYLSGKSKCDFDQTTYRPNKGDLKAQSLAASNTRTIPEASNRNFIRNLTVPYPWR
jgi:hypothetical protein